MNVKVLVSQPGLITVDPSQFMLNPGSSQAVAVSLNSKHSQDIPFTVVITYSVQGGSSNIGTVSPPTGTVYYLPPAAIKDLYAIKGAQTVVVDVLANDVNRLKRGQLSLLGQAAIVVPPNRGTATVDTSNGTIKYTPNSKNPGSDIFSYQVTDAIGNTDIGKIHIIQLPSNAKQPFAFSVDGEKGGTAKTPDGHAHFVVPGLKNLMRVSNVAVPSTLDASPDNDIDCGYSELSSANGNLDSAPFGPHVFTGPTLYLQCYAGNQAVTGDMLTAPVNMTVDLTTPIGTKYGAIGLRAINWDGSRWHTDGVELLSGAESKSLSIRTTLFGEFDVFGQYRVNFPLLRRGQ